MSYIIHNAINHKGIVQGSSSGYSAKVFCVVAKECFLGCCGRLPKHCFL